LRRLWRTRKTIRDKSREKATMEPEIVPASCVVVRSLCEAALEMEAVGEVADGEVGSDVDVDVGVGGDGAVDGRVFVVDAAFDGDCDLVGKRTLMIDVMFTAASGNGWVEADGAGTDDMRTSLVWFSEEAVHCGKSVDE